MRSRFCFSLLLLLFAAAPALGHPLPNFRYDREIDVRLHPQKVEVRYVLQLSFWTIFADNRKLFTPEEIEQMGGKLREVTKRYCEKMAPLIAEKLEAKLGRNRLTFKAVKLEVQPDRDHAKFRYVFEAPWTVNGGGAENAFTFEEHNFENDVGIVWLKMPDVEVQEDKRVIKVSDSVEPPALAGVDPSQYKPGEAEKFRRLSATFTAPSLPPLPSGSIATPVTETGSWLARRCLPVTSSLFGSQVVETSGWLVRVLAGVCPEFVAKLQVAETGTSQTPELHATVLEENQEEGFSTALLQRGPKALFDTNYGTGVLLLLAAVFGAFHAFAPGHGKSVAAAFLVGEQGTFRQAILLGVSTTFAHTGSVILIAGVFYLRYREAMPQEAQQWLGLVGGLLVLFVGMWLFMRRLRGQVDHVHLFGGCSDMCGNHAPPPKIPQCRVPLRDAAPTVDQPLQLEVVPRRSPMSWLRVVLLGIGAGAIPCVDAVLLLMLAVSAGKLAFALPLLVSFSVGLSAVLCLVGMLIVLLHRAGRSGFRERAWFRFLPTASAVLLMGMGLWMARDAIKGFSAVG